MRGLDLTGQRFTRLLVLKQVGTKGTFKLWRCLCDCGKTVDVTTGHLRSGDTKSCGCHKADLARKNHLTHGESDNRLYNIWVSLKRRCEYEFGNRYHRYGGRGIQVCQEWKDSYEAFREWALDNGYNDKLSIDRIDNDKGYSPDNCRWSNAKEQARNRSTNLVVRGKSLAEWAEIIGFDYDLIEQRMCRDGMTFEAAVTKKVRKYKNRAAYVPVPGFSWDKYISSEAAK